MTADLLALAREALANLASGLRDAGALAHAARLGAESAWMSVEVP